MKRARRKVCQKHLYLMLITHSMFPCSQKEDKIQMTVSPSVHLIRLLLVCLLDCVYLFVLCFLVSVFVCFFSVSSSSFVSLCSFVYLWLLFFFVLYLFLCLCVCVCCLFVCSNKYNRKKGSYNNRNCIQSIIIMCVRACLLSCLIAYFKLI